MSRAKRVKKVPPPEPPRDPRLVALAEQAQRAGWTAEWCDADAGYIQTAWVQLCHDDIKVSVFTGVGGGLNCYSQYSGFSAQPSRTPTEALRSAYAALGVALDQAEDAFGGAP